MPAAAPLMLTVAQPERCWPVSQTNTRGCGSLRGPAGKVPVSEVRSRFCARSTPVGPGTPRAEAQAPASKPGAFQAPSSRRAS